MFAISYFNKAKAFHHKHERWITPVAFFTGFVWDNFTLRIDLWYQNIQFFLYLIFAAACILFINAYAAGRIHWSGAARINGFIPFFLQFVFGGLFSAFIVFYMRSASISAAWPFLLLLVAFFVGNEVFRKRYHRLTFQTSVFFVALFSYTVFALPLVTGKINDMMFVASGTVALLGIGLLTYLFSRVIPERLHQNRHALALSIGGIYILFQVFYFANIIPPIPLALKESGIYHSIEPVRDAGYIYQVTYEPSPWYLFFQEQSNVFHWTRGEPVYGYSAAFAPTKFNIPIFHRWLIFDIKKDKWVEKSLIPFAISGGRDGGYRGYTFTHVIIPGKWRMEVITEDGRVLGRRDFQVVEAKVTPPLETGRR